MTSPAASPTTIGDGDLSSSLIEEELELDCSAAKEFSSTYTDSFCQARQRAELIV